MTTAAFIGFFTLSFMICLAPGPSMLFVIFQGLSKEWKKVAAAVTGLVAANLIWTVLCAFGIGILIQRSHWLFQVLKNVGACYLICLGICAFFNKKAATAEQAQRTMPALSVFTKGFLTSMTNPKALLFYMAFLPQFVSGTFAYPYEILFWGCCYLMVVAVVMSFYGIMANRTAHLVGHAGFHNLLNKVMGVSFVGFGVSLFRFRQ